MKKIILGIIVVMVILVILIFLYPPERIVVGGYLGTPGSSYSTCQGLYLETFDNSSFDGGRGGWCFGKIVDTNKATDTASTNTPDITDNTSKATAATITVGNGKGGTITKTMGVLSIAEFNTNIKKNIFEIFGDVTFNSGEYIIKEKSNSGIFATVNIPKNFGYGALTFNYKFTGGEDGDFFIVSIKDLDTNSETTGYIGQNLQLSRDDYIDGIAEPISESDKLQLIFKLVSRGEVNSTLSIKDIKLQTANELIDSIKNNLPI